MRGWYNPHFTHRELKDKVIKVKSFHYFCVLPRTWFLSLFNTLLSVSKALCALPQLQLWELSTPSRQTRNLHPHMRNRRSTRSIATSDKVGFKNLPGTAQKFCGKEEDKVLFPRPACACLHRAAVPLSVQSLPSACSVGTRRQAGQSSWTHGGWGCPLRSVSHPWLPQDRCLTYCEGDGRSHVSHLAALMVFNFRESYRKCGTKAMDRLFVRINGHLV